MADYVPKDGSGSLFQNRKKEKDSHPDERGDAMINGVMHEVAAWIKTDRNGNTFRSLSIKPKQMRPASQEPAWGSERKRDGDPPPFDDDLAF